MGLGRYALQAADWGLRQAGVVPDPPKPAWQWADVPFVQAFMVRYPQPETPSSPSEPWPPLVWMRLRRLQQLPDPLLHSADNERVKKAGAEWEREAPDLVDDLFCVFSYALGREQARALFEAALKEPRYYDQGREVFKARAYDLYATAVERGVPEANRVTWVAEHMPASRRGEVRTSKDVVAFRRRVARVLDPSKMDKSR